MRLTRYYTFIFLLFLFGCSERHEEDFSSFGYCVLGASTASMPWQKNVAEALSLPYRNYAVGGTRWTHESKTMFDESNITLNVNVANRVMTNLLAKLFIDNEKTGYYPKIISLQCGLNDAAYSSIYPIFDKPSTSIESYGEISLLSWFEEEAYYEQRNSLYGSSLFIINKLKLKFPASKIVLILPQQAYNGSYTNERIQAVNTVLSDVANECGVYLIDAYNDSNLIMNKDFHSPYIQEDGIHLNAEGEIFFSKFIIEETKKILLD